MVGEEAGWGMRDLVKKGTGNGRADWGGIQNAACKFQNNGD